MVDSCLFCRLAEEAQSTFMYEDDLCYVLEDQYPVTEGHLLIIPKQHSKHWFEATPEVQAHLMQVATKMRQYLLERYSPDGFNLGMNCGKVAGQSIMHLHVHLIPRYKGDVETPLGGVRGVIPEKQKYEAKD